MTSNKKTKHQSMISSEQILRYRAKQERLKAEQNADGRKQLNVSIDRRMAIGTDKKVRYYFRLYSIIAIYIYRWTKSITIDK